MKNEKQNFIDKLDTEKLALIAKIILGLQLIILVSLSIFVIKNDYARKSLFECEKLVINKVILNTGNYKGFTDFGMFTSFSKYEYKNGSVLYGNFDGFSVNGKGIIKSPDEGIYIGEFKNSQKDGIGTFTWYEGSIYRGEWSEDKIEGEGIYIDAENARYEGIFKNNKIYDGTYTEINDLASYYVNYKEGKITTSRIEFRDGSVYEGEMNDVSIDGTGKFTFSNGDSYVGEFKNGKREGQGRYILSDGSFYEGTWEDDKLSGDNKVFYINTEGINVVSDLATEKTYYEYVYKSSDGTYTYDISNNQINKVKVELTNGNKYEGNIDGKNGTVTINYSNGDSFVGKIENGKKETYGTYTWANGAKYIGDWENDEINGNGTYYYSSGESAIKIYGSFVNGKPDGECRYYISDTKFYKTKWSNGVCTEVSE